MKIVVLVAIMILLVAGCIGQKTSEVKETGMLDNTTTSETPSSQIDANETVGMGMQIKDAIEEALEKGNKSKGVAT